MSGIIKPPCGTPLIPGHPLARGLVCSLLLNEMGGNQARDSSGQHNHGTLMNFADPPTPTSGWGPGPHGGALWYDGVNDYVNVPSTPTLNVPNSATFIIDYVPTNVATGHHRLMEKNGTVGYILNMYGTGVEIYIGGQYRWITSAIVNQRSVLAIAVGGGRLKSIVNGKLYYDDPYTGSMSSAPGPLYVGGTNYGGSINNISIYNRPLSIEEIIYHYHAPDCMLQPPQFPAWMTPRSPADNYYRRLLATRGGR